MDFCENIAETKVPTSQQPSILYALCFLTQNPSRPSMKKNSDRRIDESALIQCRGRLDRRTYAQLSQVIENALSQNCRRLIFDFSYCSYDERVLVDLVELSVEMGITVVTTEALLRLAEHWDCTLSCALNGVVAPDLLGHVEQQVRRSES